MCDYSLVIFFLQDGALARRFQSVYVAEPSIEDTISILRGLKEKYELHHKACAASVSAWAHLNLQTGSHLGQRCCLGCGVRATLPHRAKAARQGLCFLPALRLVSSPDSNFVWMLKSLQAVDLLDEAASRLRMQQEVLFENNHDCPDCLANVFPRAFDCSRSRDQTPLQSWSAPS
jgi:hypothetical protein